VLGTLSRQCSALDARAGHLHDLLAKLIPKSLGKRGRRVAVDLVARPSHGTGEAAHHDAGCRSTATSGTTHFCTSATAYAVVRGRRYPLALGRVRAKPRMDPVLRTLLSRWVTWGMRLQRLLLARGFSSLRGLQALMTWGWPCLMPAVKGGKKSSTAAGPTGTSAWAAAKHSHWTPYPLKSATAGHGTCDVAVVCHNTRGQRGRHQREALRSAAWGLTHRPWRWMRTTYRRRCGLASSSRQAHQARMRTSSRKPALRLLFLGVALVLRKVWVWWHAEVMAQPQRGARPLRPHALRFARVLVWRTMEVAKHSRLWKDILVHRDLYKRAQAFGIVFNY
jgi:hypothetical protein